MTSLEWSTNNVDRTELGTRTYYFIWNKVDEYWRSIIKSKASGYDVESQVESRIIHGTNKKLIMAYSSPDDTLYCKLEIV